MNCNIPKKTTPLDANLYLTKEAMEKLPRPHEGQICVEKNTNVTYIYKNSTWQPISDKIKLEGQGIQMSLYDLNSTIMEQLPTMTDYSHMIETCDNYHAAMKNKYYMLYGKELSYFTMFEIQEDGECSSLGSGVVECLQNVGEIKAADLTQNADAIEIWVLPKDGKATCMYLFAYDTGVVTVKGE